MPHMRGKWALAALPVAVVVGCGSSSKGATQPAAPARTVTVTPSTSPTATLDAKAKLACSRIDDTLNAFQRFGDDIAHTSEEIPPLWQAFTFAEESTTGDLADTAFAIEGGGKVAPSASPDFLVAHYPADASSLRDWCVTHGWASTSSSAS